MDVTRLRPIGKAMRAFAKFVRENPGLEARAAAQHIYPQYAHPNQSGRALIDRAIKAGIVWPVREAREVRRGSRVLPVPETRTHLYPIVVCSVHDDCEKSFALAIDCARANPVETWLKRIVR